MANLDGYFTGVTDAIAAERKAMAQAQRDAEKRLFAVDLNRQIVMNHNNTFACSYHLAAALPRKIFGGSEASG